MLTFTEPTTAPVTVHIDPEHHRGPVDDRLFGSFVEHMGRCVYTGIYEPGHPQADEHGFRRDVAELVRELGVTVLRYPGGNFVSGYRWQDGIGPRDQRPRRLDLAWRSIETNQIGTDEFLGWAARLGVEPMLAVNLGTAGPLEAAQLVEYCNLPGGTTLSDERRRNGSPDPYDVRLWCLGNEMDGPWQTGHTTAEEYGQRAAQAAKTMRMVDPDIELVACGSSGHHMTSFGYWESAVLEEAFDSVDYVSMHAYYEEADSDRASFLASGAAMDRFIDDVIATVDAVAARKRSRKRLRISFDEWNVWYQAQFGLTERIPVDVSGPRIEDVYSTADAVVVADLMMSLINHADRVGVACLAQLVNVIAPILTEPGGAAWRQTIFHPLAAIIARARGTQSLVVRTRGGELATRQYGDVPGVAAAATLHPETGAASVYLTNRHDVAVEVDVDHRAFTEWRAAEVSAFAADDEGPADRSRTDTARPVRQAAARTVNGHTQLTLLPQSWSVLDARTARPAG